MRGDLAFWREHLRDWNGRCRWKAPDPVARLSTDASLEGFGGVCEAGPRAGLAWSGQWLPAHAPREAKRITEAELWAVLFAVAAMAPHWAHRAVCVYVDNEASMKIINRWATKSEPVCKILRELAHVCTQHQIFLTAAHRPGVQNYWADMLSRPSAHAVAPSPESLRANLPADADAAVRALVSDVRWVNSGHLVPGTRMKCASTTSAW
jgi:hypothetical protein